jgi:chromosome segregation ATPase
MRILVFLFATAALAQTTPPSDTPALQALLNEVHQLRTDIQNVAVTMQRVQIVLYRLQSQTALATRATTQLDTVRQQVGFNQSEKRNVGMRIQQMEETIRNTQNPQERKNLEDALPLQKMQLERLTSEEQRLQAHLIDVEGQNRAEQGRLTDLQDQLDRLDKVLDSFARK